MAAMDYEGDTVMGDYPPEPDLPKPRTQSSLADFTMTFGKFEGKKICELPSWYLHWLCNISYPSPAFTAALTYALAASSFSEMEIDWYPPSISAAPADFHQWKKLNKERMPKSMDTALWITSNDVKEYFCLSDEILRVQKVPRLPNDESSTVPRYALYHIWHLAQVYMTRGEADFVLRKYMSERLRGEGSPRKGGGI